MSLSEHLSKTYGYIKFIVDFINFLAYCVYTYIEVVYKVFFPPALKSLNEEIILVTGSGSGIGKNICLQLARSTSGVKIICLDRNKVDNDLTVKELMSAGAKAFGYTVDVSHRSHIEKVASTIKKDIGDVTIVVNNAGIMPVGDFLLQSADVVEKTFAVNVLSHFWILKQFLPSMIEKKRGHIVTISSCGGIMSYDNAVSYCGSKFAANGYIESLKDEMSNYPNIHFTTAYPYFVRTNLSREIHFKPRFPSLTPILEPEFVAQEIIDGIRRNKEYVYCPSSVRLFAVLAALLPRKLQATGKNYFRLNLKSTFFPGQQEKSDFLLSD